jgi:hypothetical protein
MASSLRSLAMTEGGVEAIVSRLIEIAFPAEARQSLDRLPAAMAPHKPSKRLVDCRRYSGEASDGYGLREKFVVDIDMNAHGRADRVGLR